MFNRLNETFIYINRFIIFKMTETKIYKCGCGFESIGTIKDHKCKTYKEVLK